MNVKKSEIDLIQIKFTTGKWDYIDLIKPSCRKVVHRKNAHYFKIIIALSLCSESKSDNTQLMPNGKNNQLFK